MELNTEQLNRVAHYLNEKEVLYIDFRMEVFDHIVSDIEAKMNQENLDFETAFTGIKTEWNKQLKDTSSFYFGIMFYLPKIVMDKAKKTFRKLYFTGTFMMIFLFLLIENVQYVFSKTLQNNINLLFKLVSILCLIYLVFIFIKYFKIKEKTTYGFILKTQVFSLIFGLIPALIPSYLTKEGVLNSVFGIMLFVLVQSTFTSYIFFKKHKEAIKKYKTS